MVGLLHIDLPCGHGAFDPAALPPRPGVIVLESADASAVLVAACGDLRAFAAARLGEQATPGKADLRPVTARVRAGVVASALEGDIACLEVARAAVPATYRSLADRWRGWFVHLDPDAPAPAWRKTDLHDLPAQGAAGALVGPLGDKDAAGRYGELLDDLFDLCRFPRELALAPRGKACAYKEMGRCPAACDGSEPMEAYRARVRDAIALAREGVEVEAARTEAAMRTASAAMDFERAARLRARLDGLGTAGKGPFARVGLLEDFGALLVLPGRGFGWARLVLLAGGDWHWLGDVRSDAAARAWAEIEPAARALHREGAPFPLTPESTERVGLLCRHWFRPVPRGRRRRWTILDLRRWPAPRDVAGAIAAASAAHDGQEEAAEMSLEG